MKFKRLIPGDREWLLKKNIYFAGFTSSYVDYFLEMFHECRDKIWGVFALLEIDDRTQTTVSIDGRQFALKNLHEAADLDENKDAIVVMYEYENEAYEKLLSLQLSKFTYIYWFADKSSEIELKYRDEYSTSNLENVIIFRSGPRKHVYGDDFNDNSLALFEYMLANVFNKTWKLVWYVFEPDSEEYDDWKKNNNVEFIGINDKESNDSKKRDKYFRYLCLSKFAFVTDDELFYRRRRNDQILVQLWHGDGVKGRTRFRRMEERFEYMVCTSRFFAEVDYKDFGLRSDQMLPTGCPKDDWILLSDKENAKFLGGKGNFGHYILWGPTFRKSVKGLEILNEKVKINETGLPLLVTWEDCNLLNETLKEYNCLLVIKLHPIADLTLYEQMSFSNIRLITNQELFKQGFHINQIMGAFDAFVTDYSSAATSFMILDKPMAFTLDDLDEFDDSRGFVLTPVREYLPGKELFSVDDMREFVIEVCENRDTTGDKRRRLCERMLDYRDSNSSMRLLTQLGIAK